MSCANLQEKYKSNFSFAYTISRLEYITMATSVDSDLIKYLRKLAIESKIVQTKMVGVWSGSDDDDDADCVVTTKIAETTEEKIACNERWHVMEADAAVREAENARNVAIAKKGDDATGNEPIATNDEDDNTKNDTIAKKKINPCVCIC